MRTPEQIARLDSAAESWIGTPFCPNSAVKGGGVCCHRLMGAIYEEAGWLPELPLPHGSPAHSKFGAKPIMLEWLTATGWPWFGHTLVDDLSAGDLLLVRYGHVSHHLALVLSGGRVVHVCAKLGVQIIQSLPVKWASRVEHVFVPLELEVAHG